MKLYPQPSRVELLSLADEEQEYRYSILEDGLLWDIRASLIKEWALRMAIETVKEEDRR